jgi:hypothetical protein
MVSSLCLLQSQRMSSSRCGPPLVAIRFSACVQHVSGSLFSSHNGGSPEEIAQEAERSRRDHTRRVEQRPFLGFGRRARGLRGRPTCRLTFNSPLLTLYSPALRVSAGKSGIGGGECQVSWMQIFGVFFRQVLENLHRAHPPSGLGGGPLYGSPAPHPCRGSQG